LLITPLAPQHASQAARLHIEGQPGTFLTALGEDVLTVVYRSLPQAAGCFGFAAVTAGQAQTPALQGYISATTGIGGLFAAMAAQRLGELLPPLLRRYAQQPDLALRSVQTVLYPFFVHGDDKTPSAELLSIMVEPAARSQGVGGLLMAAFLQTCRNRGLAAATVTVDAANAGAQRFYLRHGFTAWRSITLYGRAMQLYRRTL
jgi:ribosomal protein S18 acetylase RimI-like enzyme